MPWIAWKTAGYQAGADKNGDQYYCERIGRLIQEKDKLLHQRDLNKQKSQRRKVGKQLPAHPRYESPTFSSFLTGPKVKGKQDKYG